MTCPMCQGAKPLGEMTLQDIVGYGVVILERPGDDLSGRVTLCKAHYEQIEGMIWRRKREMREMQADNQAGGAEGRDLEAARIQNDGQGPAMGSAGLPPVRERDTGLYIQEGDQ